MSEARGKKKQAEPAEAASSTQHADSKGLNARVRPSRGAAAVGVVKDQGTAASAKNRKAADPDAAAAGRLSVAAGETDRRARGRRGG